VVVTCANPAAGIGPAPVLVRLTDGRLTPLALPRSETFAYARTLAAGTEWLRVAASTNPFGSAPQGTETTALVNRETGQAIGLGPTDPFGSRAFLDLDRTSPARRLCAPIRRPRVSLIRDDTRYAAITSVDRWVLTRKLEDPAGDTLQRCGRPEPEQIPGGYRAIALGKSLAAYTADRTPRRIVLLSLRSGRTWTSPWLRYSARSRRYAPGLHMAGRHLILSLPPTGGPPGWRIYETTRQAAA
jgi:hypothetical protein